MKIEKISLQNIASIEEAEIDFRRQPLADEALFLICGETGSGKSTLLSAICIALYKAVPQFEDLETGSDSANVQLNSPIQLMRRGTTRASITLAFEGNDRRHYEATWEAHRARGRMDGNILAKQSIFCRESGETIDRDREIKQRIETAVGLSFTQFCRTTILAQGQFARFMNSRNEERAQILEKLTGTEIYTQIGTRIHDCFTESQHRHEVLRQRLAQIQLLSDEEQQAIRQQVASLGEEHQQAKVRAEALRNEEQWLRQMDRLERNLADQQVLIRQGEEQLQSGRVLGMRTLEREWEQSRAIRTLHAELARDEAALAVRNGELRRKQKESEELMAGVRTLERQLNSERAKLAEVEQRLRDEEPNREMYERIREILSWIDVLVEQRRLCVELEEQRRRILLQQQEAEQAEGPAVEAVERLKRAVDEQQQAAERLRRELDGADPRVLQEEARRLAEGRQKGLEAQRLWAQRQQLGSELDATRQRIVRLGEAIRAEEAEHGRLTAETAALRNEAERTHERHNGQKMLCDHLVEIRQKFSEAHRCPLCGSEVAALYSDAMLEEALRAMQQRCDEADARVKQAEEQLRESESRLARQRAEMAQEERQQQKQQLELEENRRALEQLFTGRRVEGTPEEITQRIEARLVEIDGAQRANNAALDRAMKLQQAHTDAINALEGIRQELRKAEERLQAARQVIETGRRDNDRIGEQLARARQLTGERINDLKRWVRSVEDWERVDPAPLKESLGRQARQYETWRRQRDEQMLRITGLEPRLEAMHRQIGQEELLGQVEAAVGEASVERLDERLTRFVTEVGQLRGAIRTLEERIARHRTEAEGYYAGEGALSRERVTELMQLDEERIAKIRDELAELDRRMQETRSRIELLEAQRVAHLASRPDGITERGTLEETLEAIQSEAAACDRRRDEALRQQSEAEMRLQRDAETRRQMASEEQELQRLARERDNWGRLDETFGGLDGRRFKAIAQSYILRILLHRANYYLARLNNRYEFCCDDGSLFIYVIDHRQGDVRRHVSSLSGGESFVASLALALGLSAISRDKINVDTLFIDEGFGTLSEEYLEAVIETLDRLHQVDSRRVGIISHVAKLTERIPTQIRLIRTSPSSSRVEVVSL